MPDFVNTFIFDIYKTFCDVSGKCSFIGYKAKDLRKICLSGICDDFVGFDKVEYCPTITMCAYFLSTHFHFWSDFVDWRKVWRLPVGCKNITITIYDDKFGVSQFLVFEKFRLHDLKEYTGWIVVCLSGTVRLQCFERSLKTNLT